MSETEKLIELIGGTRYGIENRSTVGTNFQRGFIEKIANHLLVNGIRLETKQATSEESKRLIDANILVGNLLSLTLTVTGLRAGKGVILELLNKYRNGILQLINEQPTVDAAPVVHGHWIEHSHLEVGGECSVCGWQFQWFENAEARYCPHCGAKMDGGASE